MQLAAAHFITSPVTAAYVSSTSDGTMSVKLKRPGKVVRFQSWRFLIRRGG